MNSPENRNFTSSDMEISYEAMYRLRNSLGDTNIDALEAMQPIINSHQKFAKTLSDMLYVITTCQNQGNRAAGNFLDKYLEGYSKPPSEWNDFPSGPIRTLEKSKEDPHELPSDNSPEDSATFGEKIGYKIGKLIPVFLVSIASTMIARFVSPYSWTSVFLVLLGLGYLFIFLRDRHNKKLAAS